MKINWGGGIAIVIIIFTIVTLSFVYFAFTQDVNLVREDYYAEELKYQSKIEKIKRAKSLTSPLSVSVKEKAIQFSYPQNFESENIVGNVLLYRPSDRGRDIAFLILVDSLNQQNISSSKMLKGMWKAQVDWSVNNTTYFNEEIIMVN
ncbi:MAG: FixH family protein [Melioribacteraceae bacterium]